MQTKESVNEEDDDDDEEEKKWNEGEKRPGYIVESSCWYQMVDQAVLNQLEPALHVFCTLRSFLLSAFSPPSSHRPS